MVKKKVNKTEEDEEVFEISDFSCATEWEEMIKAMEDEFHAQDWKLTNFFFAKSNLKFQISQPNSPFQYISKHNETKEQYLKFSKQLPDFSSFINTKLTLISTLNQTQPSPSPSPKSQPLISRPDNNNSSQKSKNIFSSLRSWEKKLLEKLNTKEIYTNRHIFSQSFGFNDFLVISPSSPNAAFTLPDASLLCSSAIIALDNCRSEIPILVGVGDSWRGEYFGYLHIQPTYQNNYNESDEDDDEKYENAVIRFHTEGIFSSPYSTHSRLSFIDLFFKKLGVPSKEKINFSIISRYSFFRTSWDDFYYSENYNNANSGNHSNYNLNNISNNNMNKNSNIDTGEFGLVDNIRNHMPSFHYQANNYIWGCLDDPIYGVKIIASWEQFGDNFSLDDILAENLNAPSAHHWLLFLFKSSDYNKNDSNYKSNNPMGFCLTESIENLINFIGDISDNDSFFYSTEGLKSESKRLIFQNKVVNMIGKKLFNNSNNFYAQSFLAKSEVDRIIGSMFDRSAMDNFQFKDEGYSFNFDNFFAPPSTLLSLLVSHIIHFHHLNPIREIWKEFVSEVTWHWEASTYLPHIPLFLVNNDKSSLNQNTDDFSIDLRRCLLYQKLQMLNYCISLKIKMNNINANNAPKDSNNSKNVNNVNNNINFEVADNKDIQTDGWEIDFIPFDEMENEDKSIKEDTNSDFPHEGEEQSSKEHKENIQRSGALNKLSPLTRLFKYEIIHIQNNNQEKTDEIDDQEFIFVPKTQNSGVMTTDMIDEQHIMNNSSDPFSSHLRSDMESFKAANPEGEFIDFIRWYSPADWIECATIDHPDLIEYSPDPVISVLVSPNESEESEQENSNEEPKIEIIIGYRGIGYLSKRMRKSNGNKWMNLWKTSTAIPESQQTPLFNFTKEGEKVIHYLQSISMGELFVQFLGIALQNSFNSMLLQQVTQFPFIMKRFAEISDEYINIFNSLGVQSITEESLTFIQNSVLYLEELSSISLSILQKTKGSPSAITMINRILENNLICEISSPVERKAVIDFYFTKARGGFEVVDEREHIIQAKVRKEGSLFNTPPSLQRLFVKLTDNEYRVATALSEIE